MTATAAAIQTSSQPEWFASWFDSAHYRALYAHRDEAEAAALVDRLVQRLAPAPGAAMLDLGCGTGRHSRQLAAKGFDVTGIDLSAESLRCARQSEGPRLRFRRQDMRLPFGGGVFDYVFSLFTSFGYFECPADNATVIGNIARALKPGGRLVLDYLNARHAEAHLAPAQITERGNTLYRVSRWADATHIFKRIVVEDHRAATPLEFTERVSKLTVEDFRFMLALGGMRIDAIYGDYRLRPFDEETSPRLIVVARRGEGRAAEPPEACGAGRWLPARQVLADAADRFGSHAQV